MQTDPSHHHLLSALTASLRPTPADLASEIEALRRKNARVSGGRAWTLVGVMRHLPRQRWAGRVVAELGVAPELLAKGEHPPGLGVGGVPGEPSWRYRFHGIGCCFTSADGTELDVDFPDGTAECIDFHFYETFVRTVAEPGLVEQRLRELLPAKGAIASACESLRDDGLFVRVHAAFGASKLSEAAAQLVDAVTAETFARDPRTAWWAAHFSDWALVDELVR